MIAISELFQSFLPSGKFRYNNNNNNIGIGLLYTIHIRHNAIRTHHVIRDIKSNYYYHTCKCVMCSVFQNPYNVITSERWFVQKETKKQHIIELKVKIATQWISSLISIFLLRLSQFLHHQQTTNAKYTTAFQIVINPNRITFILMGKGETNKIICSSFCIWIHHLFLIYRFSRALCIYTL